MKRRFELTETDIKQAIAGWLRDTVKVEVSTEDIALHATEKRGQFDQPEYGFDITATATEAN